MGKHGKVLILYSSHDGHTRTVALRMADRIRAKGHCDVCDMHHDTLPDPEGYQGIMVGAAIRYGRYHPHVHQLVDRMCDTLNTMPSAFFGINLIARKPEKRQIENNVYTRKFLSRILWRPTMVGIFAGALYYPRYRWLDRIAIQMIMRMTGGETDTTKEVVYTDWEQVDAFADAFYVLVQKELP